MQGRFLTVDCGSRTLFCHNTLMRIVSLLPSPTEIVCALGLEAELVGITHECDSLPPAVDKPRLTVSRISHETITSKDTERAGPSEVDGPGSIYDHDEAKLRQLKP